ARPPLPAEPLTPRPRGAAPGAFPAWGVGPGGEGGARGVLFPPRLSPPLETVGAALARLTANGILLHHAAETVLRLVVGFALAALVGVALGVAMGRSRRAEDIALPLVGIGAPVPGRGYAPVLLLWGVTGA